MSRTTLALCVAASLALPTVAAATVVNEVEPNDSRATAQNLAGSFSADSVANIFNSTSVSHASVNGGNGSATDVDYYAITIANAGDSAFFDIDGAEGVGGNISNLHTALALFDAQGNLLAFNVSSEVDPGSTAPGSGTTADSDSFIGTYTFSKPGTYYIGVTNGVYYNTPASNYVSATGTLSGTMIRPDGQPGGERYAGDSGPATLTALQGFSTGTYTLHVSVAQASSVPIPLTALGLITLGLVGVGLRKLYRPAE